jgi:hypothetical protein
VGKENHRKVGLAKALQATGHSCQVGIGRCVRRTGEGKGDRGACGRQDIETKASTPFIIAVKAIT